MSEDRQEKVERRDSPPGGSESVVDVVIRGGF